MTQVKENSVAFKIYPAIPDYYDQIYPYPPICRPIHLALIEFYYTRRKTTFQDTCTDIQSKKIQKMPLQRSMYFFKT